jgi:hypothetical protein
MTTVLVAFALLSSSEMRKDPVLRVWLGVVVAGIPLTLVGAYGVATTDLFTASVAVFGWMIVPALALVAAARAPGLSPRVYGPAAGISGVGAVVFLVATLLGGRGTLLALGLAGAGQTVSIVAAVRE